MAATATWSSPVVIDVDGLDRLIGALASQGWEVLAPVERDGAIVPGPVRSVADLPRGVGDEQHPSTYRLTRRQDDALFGFASPATSWKPILFPPRRLLWRGTRRDDGFDIDVPDDPAPARALLGVRACDLAAIGVQDRVLQRRWGNRPAADADYADARSRVFIVAVTCGTPASTCFCASTGTGPEPSEGFDLSLTEVLDPDHHSFVVRVGTDAGARLLADVPSRPAEPDDLQAAAAVVDAAVGQMGRSLDTDGLPALLDADVEHPQWEAVAGRCLACGNCTAVCPTCFCTSVADVTDLTGQATQRWRDWDSCFTASFSYIHGGPVRAATASRYRQWLTHKLGTWHAQFDTGGCVGCGRCLTWCPVGIDITAEAAALRATSRTSLGTAEAT